MLKQMRNQEGENEQFPWMKKTIRDREYEEAFFIIRTYAMLDVMYRMGVRLVNSVHTKH
jgi:hypothetical protein